MRHVLVLAFLAMVLTACSESLEFADWTIPVPEGTEIIGYADVPLDERVDHIEMVEELVIGDQGDVNALYAFGRPSDVAVDAAGRIYVLDGQTSSVQVFGADGEFIRPLSREGQGPGEFQRPRSIEAVGDVIVVVDPGNARLSHFDIDGNHLGDHPVPRFSNLHTMVGTDSGEMVGSTTRFIEADEIEWAVGAYSLLGELSRTYVEVTYKQVPTIQRGTRSTYYSRMPSAYPIVAASLRGAVYWSKSDEYQVLAVAPDGSPRWALRVAATPGPLLSQQVDEIMGLVRNTYEDATESEVNWPDRQPAISRVLVDGHGHLYVFPYVYVPLGLGASDPVPVDVYAPGGERLFTGMATPRFWVHAEGDFIYETVIDPLSEEWIVRKSRLVEPFE